MQKHHNKFFKLVGRAVGKQPIVNAIAQKAKVHLDNNEVELYRRVKLWENKYLIERMKEEKILVIDCKTEGKHFAESIDQALLKIANNEIGKKLLALLYTKLVGGKRHHIIIHPTSKEDEVTLCESYIVSVNMNDLKGERDVHFNGYKPLDSSMSEYITDFPTILFHELTHALHNLEGRTLDKSYRWIKKKESFKAAESYYHNGEEKDIDDNRPIEDKVLEFISHRDVATGTWSNGEEFRTITGKYIGKDKQLKEDKISEKNFTKASTKSPVYRYGHVDSDYIKDMNRDALHHNATKKIFADSIKENKKEIDSLKKEIKIENEE